MEVKEHWIDTKLSAEEMDFLRDACSGVNKKDFRCNLAGNISKSELLEDKDNWFYETVLKKLTERFFYQNCSNYYEEYIEKENPLPKFEMSVWWVNHQKQYEFNPLHFHGSLFSFVVFMKIPTHWKEQHALPISGNSNCPNASDFQFVWTEMYSENCTTRNFPLSSEDEGRMLFFPSWLQHQVYPFYGTEEERVTISGNIRLYDPNRSKKQELSGAAYEEKEKTLKIVENSVEFMKEELKQMKKEREN